MTWRGTAEQHLYVIRFGARAKVGITVRPGRRLSALERQAVRAGVVYEAVLLLDPHVEARQNEIATVQRFTGPGSIGEYLAADPHEVAEFARSLPQTRAVDDPCTSPPVEPPLTAFIRGECVRRRLDTDVAAQAAGISVHTWARRERDPGSWRYGELSGLATASCPAWLRRWASPSRS